jgi:S1-C subfamily serine protease
MLAVLLTAGCVSSAPSGPVRGLHEVTSDKIRSAIEQDNYAQALQDIRIQREEGTVPEDTVNELLNRATGELAAEYRSSIDQEDYVRALKLHRIVREAGLNGQLEQDGYSRQKLEALRLMKELDQGAAVRALARLPKMQQMDIFSDKQLQRLIEAAYEEEKRTTLLTLLEEADGRNLEIREEVRTLAERPYSHSELIRGTVTIWVNRGMRIEEGVGRPDRVIGSGFYIDKRGYILTNYHVIKSEVDPEYEGYSRLYVRPSEDTKEKIPAEVVGWDPVFDLALLKVQTKAEMVLSFAASQKLEPGERIYAIGSPAGLENTITSGIISAVGRRFLQLGNVVQVDVPINQGNSGGPLLDDKGNLIGVVFAGIEQFEGVNFAIPGKWVGHILPELYGEGKVKHPFLGMSLEENDEGLQVSYVYPGGAADEVGIESGDMLLNVGGEEVESVTAAQDRLLEYRPGSLVRLKWSRGEQTYQRPAAVKTRPDVPLREVLDRDRYENLFSALFGMEVERTSQSMFAPQYIVKKVYRGSIADETGLSRNDPFSLQNWKLLEEQQVVLAQIRVKKRKAGFLETGVQLGAYLETNNML